MNITERIRQLNEVRGWSIYRLSREAGVSPSTLTNMIRRGTGPSLFTLERLCRAYGMTLVQFLYDTNDRGALTKEQREHLDQWDSLSEREKKAVALFIEGIRKIE